MQLVRCYPLLCSDNSCGTHFPVFGLFKFVNIFQLLSCQHQVFQVNQKLMEWWVIIQELASYLLFVLSPKSNLSFNFANDSQHILLSTKPYPWIIFASAAIMQYCVHTFTTLIFLFSQTQHKWKDRTLKASFQMCFNFCYQKRGLCKFMYTH